MPRITAEELENIKAANHAKSRAWESATFVDGDRVLAHGLLVNRCGDHWIDDVGRSYETLSRWIRHKLCRRSYDVKWGTYLMVGTVPIQMCRVPPPAERVNYGPWIQGRPWYMPGGSVLTERQNQTLSGQPVAAAASAASALTLSAPQIPTPPPTQNEIIPRGTQASPSPPPNSLPVQENKNRPQTLEERVAFMEERLIAVAAVAAHAALMKDQLKTLQNQVDGLMNRIQPH